MIFHDLSLSAEGWTRPDGVTMVPAPQEFMHRAIASRTSARWGGPKVFVNIFSPKVLRPPSQHPALQKKRFPCSPPFEKSVKWIRKYRTWDPNPGVWGVEFLHVMLQLSSAAKCPQVPNLPDVNILRQGCTNLNHSMGKICLIILDRTRWSRGSCRCLASTRTGCVCVWTIWKDVKLLTCLMMCFNGFPIWHRLFGFFIWFPNNSRGARPSVTTLPNEAMSLKGKQLGTPSCVPADSF